MKQIYLIISILTFALTGCVFSANQDSFETKPDNLDKIVADKYQYLTTDKTMAKSFEAFEIFDSFYREPYYNYTPTEDFNFRFCDINSSHITSDYYRGCEDFLLQQFKVVKFLGNLNAETKISDQDAYCLSMQCGFTSHLNSDGSINCSAIYADKHDWLHNDDDCIVRRRILLKDTKLVQWYAFNYKDYIPAYAKIGTYEDFKELYKAYKKDIKKCEEQRNSLETTSDEYEACVKSVENKIEKIVKSGVLK